MHRLLFVALTTGLLYPIAALSGYLGNADMPSIEEAFSNSDQLIPKLNQSLSSEPRFLFDLSGVGVVITCTGEVC